MLSIDFSDGVFISGLEKGRWVIDGSAFAANFGRANAAFFFVIEVPLSATGLM